MDNANVPKILALADILNLGITGMPAKRNQTAFNSPWGNDANAAARSAFNLVGARRASPSRRHAAGAFRARC